jgi:hypothetical protein
VTIEPGQRWTNTASRSLYVIERRSDLLSRWWTIRSACSTRRISIDEDTLLAEFEIVDPDVVDVEDTGMVAAV